MSAPVQITDLARRKASALGLVGQQWMDSLPDLVELFEEEWSIEVGSALGGSSASYVAAARTAEGEQAVLKLAMPDGLEGQGEFGRELTAVHVGQGRGYVRLLRSDAERRAMLLERLGRPVADVVPTIEGQLDVIAATAARAWQPAPRSEAWWTGAQQAEALARAVRADWEACGRPCGDDVIRVAERCALARRDAFDADTAVLIHGDAHSWNVLEAPGRGFAFIDPDAMVSHPAHELAIPIRHWNEHLLAATDSAERVGQWCNRLSDMSGAPSNEIWEWAFAERVSTGLFILRLGDQRGRQFLTVAERLLRT